ncbi:hypothetical protein BKA82DRAFT_3950039, partial [Pisolithus tinctorius]
KKPQMGDFTARQPPLSVLISRPSHFAINKLASCKYIELWYFLLEGCNDTAKNARTNADDTFGLSSSNDVLTLRPVTLAKTSQNACTDHNLSFSELLQARVSFLHYIKAVPW